MLTTGQLRRLTDSQSPSANPLAQCEGEPVGGNERQQQLRRVGVMPARLRHGAGSASSCAQAGDATVRSAGLPVEDLLAASAHGVSLFRIVEHSISARPALRFAAMRMASWARRSSVMARKLA